MTFVAKRTLRVQSCTEIFDCVNREQNYAICKLSLIFEVLDRRVNLQ